MPQKVFSCPTMAIHNSIQMLKSWPKEREWSRAGSEITKTNHNIMFKWLTLRSWDLTPHHNSDSGDILLIGELACYTIRSMEVLTLIKKSIWKLKPLKWAHRPLFEFFVFMWPTLRSDISLIIFPGFDDPGLFEKLTW